MSDTKDASHTSKDTTEKHGLKERRKKQAAGRRASFLLAVGPQSAELVFGGPPLGSHGGGMPARSGGSWSTGGGGGIMTPAGPWGHNS
jgi:hypothetical protein